MLASNSLLRYLSLNSLFFCLEKTDPTRPLVFQVIHRMPSERKGHIHPTLLHVVISAVVLEEYPVSSENVWKLEKHLVVVFAAGNSGGSEDLEKSDLAKGSTGQSKDMGPTGRHVASLNMNVVEHERARSFTGWVSCTNMDWLHRSHRAEKRRQDGVSHGRPYSSKESSLKQHAESCKTTPWVKDNTN